MKKIILDVDTGIDDAQAIMFALSLPTLDVIAITCVKGNVDVDIVCLNTLRILRVCDRLDIPVYRGATCPILGTSSVPTIHHGKDGLGDCPDSDSSLSSMIKGEHAVSALCRFAKQYPGEITLLALAPLTNVALALRLDDSFGRRLNRIIIMGGNLTASGSRASITGDFNFVADPEAAFVCTNEISSPITLLPYDVCYKNDITWEQLFDVLASPSKKMRYLSAIMEQSIKYKRDELGLARFYTCDPVTVLLAYDMNFASTECANVMVELHGEYTRGLSVFAKKQTRRSTLPQNEETHSCDIVLNFDVERFWCIFKEMLNVV